MPRVRKRERGRGTAEKKMEGKTVRKTEKPSEGETKRTMREKKRERGVQLISDRRIKMLYGVLRIALILSTQQQRTQRKSWIKDKSCGKVLY